MISLEKIRQLPCHHRETIPEEYLDIMGHMNVQFYMALYSKGLRNMVRELGITEEYCRSENSGSFALHQYIRYLAEVRVGQTVALHIRLIGRNAGRLHFIHFMINETVGALASTMEVSSAHADLIARRTSPFPEKIAQSIDALLSRHANLDWEPPLCGVIRI